MNNVRGSLLRLFLLLCVPFLLVAGADYGYELKLSKRSVFVKEPVLLTFRVWQTDPKQVIFFEFAPKEERWMRVRLLRETRDESIRGRSVTFRYLIVPEKEGEIPLRFSFVVKRTTETRLQYNNTGEPVKAKAIDTTDTREVIPPEILQVRPLPKAVPLVGDYRLDISVDKRETAAYSPLYLTIRLRGVGAMPERIDFEPAIEHVRTFADDPKIVTRYETDGIHYDATFSYALLGFNDFLIPSVTMEAFSYRRNELYRLESKAIPISVKTADAAALVESGMHPESVYETIETVKRWGIYLFIFGCGYLSAVLVGRLRGRVTRKSLPERFKKEVRSARSAKTLLELLVRTDPLRYAVWIDDLEKAVYRGRSVDLAAIRKAVLKAA